VRIRSNQFDRFNGPGIFPVAAVHQHADGKRAQERAMTDIGQFIAALRPFALVGL
jgi:hypothetical protein